ncbi:MAG: hypothetical protein ABI119_05890 [Gemmatimonadaceae bacterium]
MKAFTDKEIGRVVDTVAAIQKAHRAFLAANAGSVDEELAAATLYQAAGMLRDATYSLRT